MKLIRPSSTGNFYITIIISYSSSDSKSTGICRTGIIQVMITSLEKSHKAFSIVRLGVRECGDLSPHLELEVKQDLIFISPLRSH